jgi:hypothetical protein
MRSLQKLSDESGQAVIVFALCMVVIVAFLGLAIDVAISGMPNETCRERQTLQLSLLVLRFGFAAVQQIAQQ